MNDERGWIYAPLLILSADDTSTIPVADIIPAVPPTFTPTPTNTRPVPQPPTNGGGGSGGGGGGGGNGLGVTHSAGKPLLALRLWRLFVPAECRAPDCRPTGRPHLQPVFRAPISPAPARRTSNISWRAARRMTAACAPPTAPPGGPSAATCSISPWPAPPSTGTTR